MKQDVDWAGNRVAQLIALTVFVFAALWVLAVSQAVSVIIDTIPTIGLEPCGTILSIPSGRTSTAPVPMKVASTLSV